VPIVDWRLPIGIADWGIADWIGGLPIGLADCRMDYRIADWIAGLLIGLSDC
jgi:hypothetical protein